MPKFRKKPIEIEAIRFIAGMNHGQPVDIDPDMLVQGQTPASNLSEQDENANAEKVQTWLRESGADFECINDAVLGPCILINTLEGQMRAGPGDWIIKGVKGEFYPSKPDIFEATFEAVED